MTVFRSDVVRQSPGCVSGMFGVSFEITVYANQLEKHTTVGQPWGGRSEGLGIMD